MKPGRKLDALIAEKVMGLSEAVNAYKKYAILCQIVSEKEPRVMSSELIESVSLCMAWTGYSGIPFFPRYSEDIDAAWHVVEKLKTVDLSVYHLSRALKLNLSFIGTGYGWRAEFDLENDHAGDDQTMWWAEGLTAPHAICLAALKTCENHEQN